MKLRLDKINSQRLKLDDQAMRISELEIKVTVLKKERDRYKETSEEAEAKVEQTNLRLGDLEATTLHQLSLRDELERSLARALENSDNL